MNKEISFNKRAKDKLIEYIDVKSKILDVGPLNGPIFTKEEANIYYAAINSTEEVKRIYSNLEESRFNRIVDIDYVIEDSYENTFKNKDIKFDYVVFSHVFEHIPNPIEVLIDVSTILKFNGKLCLLLPDKEFTFDHYRDNTTFADWFDVYFRGEEYTLPKIVLDYTLGIVNSNNAVDFWNKNVFKHPNANFEYCLNNYQKYINNFENETFTDHRWVFTDRSFLKILENLYKANLIPYKLIDFYPTIYNDNTFGLILELDYSVQESQTTRNKIINNIREISEIIYKKRLEIEVNEIIAENIELKDKVNKIINIYFKDLTNEQKESYILIYYSGEFDNKYYINTYGLNRNTDPIVHFLKVGVNKGFNPSANFDTKFYLEFNEDVKKSGINPFVHYLLHGKKENRLPKPLNQTKIEKLNLSNQDIINYLIINESGEFDEKYYIKKYGLNNNTDPIAHFLEIGAEKGFNPSPNFNTEFYLECNEDVKKS